MNRISRFRGGCPASADPASPQAAPAPAPASAPRSAPTRSGRRRRIFSRESTTRCDALRGRASTIAFWIRWARPAPRRRPWRSRAGRRHGLHARVPRHRQSRRGLRDVSVSRQREPGLSSSSTAQPPWIDVDDTTLLDRIGSGRRPHLTRDLLKKYPKAALFPGGPRPAGRAPRALTLPRTAGSEFVVDYVAPDGCHACAAVGTVALPASLRRDREVSRHRRRAGPSPIRGRRELSQPWRFAGRSATFDATMLVVGGIIGAGIFVNPYLVAQRLPSAGPVLAVWIAGGAIAMAGALAFAELAALYPEGRGPVRLPAGGLPPAGRVPLRLGVARHDPGRRHRRRRDHFAEYALRLAGAAGANPRPLAVAVARRPGAGQLRRREARQPSAQRPRPDQDRRSWRP